MAEPSSVDELRSLVSSTLEHAGVLSKIRAQLRHHVFLAVHSQPQHPPHSSAPSPPLSLSSTHPTDVLLLDLVSEFLSFHSLDYTQLTFDAERGPLPTPRSRTQLTSLLASPPRPDKPLLFSLLERAQRPGDELDVSTTSSAGESRQWDKTPVKRVEEEKTAYPESKRNVIPEAASDGEDDAVEDEVEVEVSASSDDGGDDAEEPSVISRPVHAARTWPREESKQPERPEEKAVDKKPSLLGALPSFSKPSAPASAGPAWRDDEDSDEGEAEKGVGSGAKPLSSAVATRTPEAVKAKDRAEEEKAVEAEVDEEFYESSPTDSPHASTTTPSAYRPPPPAAAVHAAKTLSGSPPAGPAAAAAPSLSSLASLPSLKPKSSLSSVSSLPSLDKPAAAAKARTPPSTTPSSKASPYHSDDDAPAASPPKKPSPPRTPQRVAAVVEVAKAAPAPAAAAEDDAEVEEEIVDEVGSDVSIEISGDEAAFEDGF